MAKKKYDTVEPISNIMRTLLITKPILPTIDLAIDMEVRDKDPAET